MFPLFHYVWRVCSNRGSKKFPVTHDGPQVRSATTSTHIQIASSRLLLLLKVKMSQPKGNLAGLDVSNKITLENIYMKQFPKTNTNQRQVFYRKDSSMALRFGKPQSISTRIELSLRKKKEGRKKNNPMQQSRFFYRTCLTRL